MRHSRSNTTVSSPCVYTIEEARVLRNRRSGFEPQRNSALCSTLDTARTGGEAKLSAHATGCGKHAREGSTPDYRRLWWVSMVVGVYGVRTPASTS